MHRLSPGTCSVFSKTMAKNGTFCIKWLLLSLAALENGAFKQPRIQEVTAWFFLIVPHMWAGLWVVKNMKGSISHGNGGIWDISERCLQLDKMAFVGIKILGNSPGPFEPF